MRLHVAVKYEVDYQETPYLNYKPEEFTYLLGALDCSVYKENNEDGSCCSMEIDVEQLENALDTLKHLDDCDDSDKEDIMGCIKSCELTLEDAIKCLESIKENGAKTNGVYHLAFY